MRQVTYAEELEILRGLENSTEFLNDKIKEIHSGNKDIEKWIVSFFMKVNLAKDDFSIWFWKESLKVMLPRDYKDSLKRINHLKQLKSSLSVQESSRVDYTKLKSEAKVRPIEELYRFQKVRRFGNKIICLCPLHKEKTPSFNIYLDDNRFFCYGCNVGGDAITFFQKLNGVTFKEAVVSLVGGGV